MKSHKATIKKASALRTAIADKVVEASKLETDLISLNGDIEALRSQMSEVESEAADAGLAVSDLHDALDEMRKAN